MSFSICKRTGIHIQEEHEEEANIFDVIGKEDVLVFNGREWVYQTVREEDSESSWDKERWKSLIGNSDTQESENSSKSDMQT